MPILLGVDTGGTYTDAVLLRDEEEVIATAKALTTRADLSVGIGQAIAAVLSSSGIDAAEIALASLSTTLATNALVEGHGGRVGLISLGFAASDLERQGLAEAMKGEPVARLGGGHTHAGGEAAAFDREGLLAALAQWGEGVSAFAVAGQFATRNPAHEIAARDLIRDATGKPVSCSHELSARLNGPKRAITAVLNARLIAMIDRLIAACEARLKALGIGAPLMVVRGDGALISAAFARERPIETILSGPAASIVGARWLTGAKDALVSDIGGTTTDVALLRGGKPTIDPLGARVGRFRTMVEAVAMRTWGLGGDSEVHMRRDGLTGGVILGPRRVMPVSLSARQWPEVVLPALERQLANDRRGEFDARFVAPTGITAGTEGLGPREAALLARIGAGAVELGAVLKSRVELAALDRLASRGLIMHSGVTPSDASHVLGRLDAWDGAAAEMALSIFSRQRTGAGEMVAPGAEALAQMIIDQLTSQTADCLLIAAFAADLGEGAAEDPEALARHWLTRAGVTSHRGIMSVETALNVPVIGLGASAPSYYNAVGEMLKTEMILPGHAGVANAIGAVAGRVSVTVRGSITSPSEGRYRVHFGAGPTDFSTEEDALAALEESLRAEARADAVAAGAAEIEVGVTRRIDASTVEGRRIFVAAEISATASGRPRIAVG